MKAKQIASRYADTGFQLEMMTNKIEEYARQIAKRQRELCAIEFSVSNKNKQGYESTRVNIINAPEPEL